MQSSHCHGSQLGITDTHKPRSLTDHLHCKSALCCCKETVCAECRLQKKTRKKINRAVAFRASKQCSMRCMDVIFLHNQMCPTTATSQSIKSPMSNEKIE